MREENIFEIKAIYRDDFRIRGYRFGSDRETICIMGSMRGNEFQQMYVCSLLVKKLKKLETEGRICSNKGILVIPCGNPYSVNIKKRFWSTDNTDINRMYPGYDKGETTQRIAAGIFEEIKGYEFGIQFASFYMAGNFVPQVRMMKTGFENVELAKQFGLPFVVLQKPRPFDTTTLNYNWQVWETNAFSIYTTSTSAIDRVSADQAVEAVLNFMSRQGIIHYKGYEGFISQVIESTDLVTVRSGCAGFFEGLAEPGKRVESGQEIARIYDPYTAELKESVKAPAESVVAFAFNDTMTYQNTALFKLIPEENQ